MSAVAERQAQRAWGGGYDAAKISARVLIYGALILWTIISLFPIYWTLTTSFKTAVNVMQGHLIPWIDFQPNWLGLRSLGLSSDTIGVISTVAVGFIKRINNR